MLASASNCAFAKSTIHVSCMHTALLTLTSKIIHVAAQRGHFEFAGYKLLACKQMPGNGVHTMHCIGTCMRQHHMPGRGTRCSAKQGDELTCMALASSSSLQI